MKGAIIVLSVIVAFEALLIYLLARMPVMEKITEDKELRGRHQRVVDEVIYLREELRKLQAVNRRLVKQDNHKARQIQSMLRNKINKFK